MRKGVSCSKCGRFYYKGKYNEGEENVCAICSVFPDWLTDRVLRDVFSVALRANRTRSGTWIAIIHNECDSYNIRGEAPKDFLINMDVDSSDIAEDGERYKVDTSDTVSVYYSNREVKESQTVEAVNTRIRGILKR